ncbi:MAG TPA: A24 family peptidase [Steroidobacteraceae bacterium]|nr:A24 family peptidase [Steroidobacteraceae bacterium]
MIDLLSASAPLFAGVVFLLGLLVGSFLNVVIHRLPVMLERAWRRECLALDGKEPPAEAPYNLVVPRSACTSCQAPIGALQNIPVLSWLLLGGRCRSCKARISARYPLVELFTAVLSAAVAWKFGFGWTAAAALVLTWFLVALACIDIDTQLLPDNLTLPLLWLGLLVALLLPYHTGARLPVDLSDAVIGAMAGYLALWSMYHLFRLLTGKEGFGYGDFKLLAALGAWLGWQMLLLIVVGAASVGAVVGIAAIVFKGRDKSVPVAFGPYLAAAGWLALMCGPELVGAYFGLYAPR